MDASDCDDRSHALFADGARLRMLAGHLAADGGTADDLVQEAWLAALRRAPSTDRPAAPWLAQVIRNLARRKRRGEARRAQRERAHVDGRDVDVPSPAQIAERLDAQRALVDVLGELDESLRTTLVLRYFDELTSVEIARAQGVPEGTVRWRIQRGLDELRVRLDRRFGGSRGAWCALFLPFARPSGGSLALAGEGVVAMSAMAKIGAAAAVLAVAGVVWWASDTAPASAPARASDALVAEPVTLSESAPLVDVDGTPLARRTEPQVEAPRASQDAPAEIVAAAAQAAPAREIVVDARFVDAAGAPWKGVRLALATDDTHAAISGSDGRATLSLEQRNDEPPVRHQEFVASGAGCTTRKLGATVRAGEPTHLGDVVLAPALVLYGRVVDSQGRGIAAARVGTSPAEITEVDLEHVRRHGGDFFETGARAQSAENGYFALDGVEPGTWRVWAQAAGTRYAWTEPLEVRSSDVHGLEIELEPMRPTDRVAGLVVDGNGRALPEARLVFFYMTKSESGTVTRNADTEGRFDFVIVRDAVHTIIASDKSGQWASAAAERVPPGTLDVVIRLPERRYLDVDVRDASRSPIAGCTLTVSREAPNHVSGSASEPQAPGSYRLAVPAFEFSIVVRAEGYRTRVLGPYGEGRAPEHLDVVLEPVPIVRGRVVAEGKPVVGARVALHPSSGRRLQVDGFTCLMEREAAIEVKTDADGRYLLGCELDGEIFVRAQAEGWVGADAGPIAAPRTETTADLELTHGGAIEGRVLLPDGRNAEGAIVGANHGDGRARTVRAGPGGIYRFEGLVPGKWQVLPRTREIRPDSITSSSFVEPLELEWSCEVVAGKTTHHDVDATRK